MHTTSPSDGTGLPSLRDVNNTPIPFGGLVEQIAVKEEYGAKRFRLHQRGQVVGRGTDVLYVRFDRDETIALPPDLVCVLTTPDGG